MFARPFEPGRSGAWNENGPVPEGIGPFFMLHERVARPAAYGPQGGRSSSRKKSKIGNDS